MPKAVAVVPGGRPSWKWPAVPRPSHARPTPGGLGPFFLVAAGSRPAEHEGGDEFENRKTRSQVGGRSEKLRAAATGFLAGRPAGRLAFSFRLEFGGPSQ